MYCNSTKVTSGRCKATSDPQVWLGAHGIWKWSQAAASKVTVRNTIFRLDMASYSSCLPQQWPAGTYENVTLVWAGTGPYATAGGCNNVLPSGVTLTTDVSVWNNAKAAWLANTTPTNTAPVVNAGPDQSITLPASASLDGTVTDDGRPNPPGTTSVTWTKVSGPGTVTFANPSAVDTTASFSAAGPYVLRLTATDGALTSSDDMTVTAAATGGSSTTLDIPIRAGSDDAEENNTSRAVSLSSSDLELTTDGSTVQTVGLRFTNVTVPRGATLTNAYVQFSVDEVSTGATNLTIAAQDADTAATFTTGTGNISSRPRTAAAVAWTPASWPTVGARGPDQRTPDLAAPLNQVVQRTGWTSGNALALIITGTGRRTADAFEDTPAPPSTSSTRAEAAPAGTSGPTPGLAGAGWNVPVQ